MSEHTSTNNNTNVAATRINAAAEWRSWLTGITAGLLVFETLSGLSIYLLPFSLFNQFGVVTHTVLGAAMVIPLAWFLARHWWVRRKGNLSHYQLLGYISLTLLLVCSVSGLLLAWQAVAGPRIGYLWDRIHLLTGLAMGLVLVIHLLTVVFRKSGAMQDRAGLRPARRVFYVYSAAGALLFAALGGAWATLYEEAELIAAFPDDYNWRFGEDRPFAPSLARLDYGEWQHRLDEEVSKVLETDLHGAYLAAMDQERDPAAGPFTRVRNALRRIDAPSDLDERLEPIFRTAAQRMRTAGAVDPRALAGAQGCGSQGCHDQIYAEWLPSAHRFSSMDDMFQRVQTLMADETSPEHTRYCAGCHDPISLFSGAKNAGNITLSVEGADEGSSCLVCHSIVQTDIQGNGDYTIRPPQRYAYELGGGPIAKFVSDFLIRSYPDHHIQSYSRSLYKTPEFCAACHKQYLDKEVNTDIGKVQGQNQYDSWKNSRWYHEDSPDKTLACRECHMPLVKSEDPALGDATDYNRSLDDGMHRSHRTLASNQYIPVLQKLEGHEQHVELTEKWLRGEIEIPEIADKWTTGPVVRMQILAPHLASPGEDIGVRVVLTNNKTGHDFPTGPLDMIESWVELKVTDDAGRVLYRVGALDEDARVNNTPLSYRADGFDRKGKPIDRHNLWDLVGASYKRALYPGMTDTLEAKLQCPSMARGRITAGTDRSGSGERTERFSFAAPDGGSGKLKVAAVLWYRKANTTFLNRVYGEQSGMRSPLTWIARAETDIEVIPQAHATAD